MHRPNRKITFLVFTAVLLLSVAGVATGYKVLYAEQWYRLYHSSFYMYPEDYLENILFLERALSADFANPINAITRQITHPLEHERYRYLFKMHVNLELTRQYRLLGAGYDKRSAFYFNAPWRETTLKSLRYAESYYEAAIYYWEQAVEWSHKAWELRFIDLSDLASWQGDNYRVQSGDLDYRDILIGDLDRLSGVRAEFEDMDETTF